MGKVGTLLSSSFFLRDAGERNKVTQLTTFPALQMAHPSHESRLYSSRPNFMIDTAIPHKSIASQLYKSAGTSPTRVFLAETDPNNKFNYRRNSQGFIGVLASVDSSKALPLRRFLTSRGKEHVHKTLPHDLTLNTTTVVTL